MRDSPRIYAVYIMASDSRRLYVGSTSDLRRRVAQHRTAYYRGFTARYRISKLVWFETSRSVHAVLARERELKGWRRERKVALIDRANPDWRDLGGELGLGPRVSTSGEAPPAGPSARAEDPSPRRCAPHGSG